MTGAQIETLRQSMNIREGHEWDKFEGLENPIRIEKFLAQIPLNTNASRRHHWPAICRYLHHLHPDRL